MALEIERKFLVEGDFRPHVNGSVRIVQGYLCSSAGKTVRVRIMGDRGILTIKGPTPKGSFSRFEWETEIPLKDAQELIALCDSGVIDKVRHLVRSGAHTFEVDEFFGDNQGLIVAEVELSSEDEDFQKPSWLGREVTGERRYYNSCLLLNPYCRWGKE
jgi:CYTH domain-containing protein